MWIDGIPLSMHEGEVLEHRRILDLKRAALWREWRQVDVNGRVTDFTAFRMASLADRRLLLQRVAITWGRRMIATEYPTAYHP